MRPEGLCFMNVAPVPAPSIRELLRRHGVTDVRVAEAIERVPRVSFLPAEFVMNALEDRTFALAPGNEFVAPSMLGYLVEALDVRPGMRVLEVGSGYGYASAVLAVLGAKPTTLVPRVEDGREAMRRFARLGLGVPVLSAELDALAEVPLFDRILIGVPTTKAPTELQRRLAVGGAMVVALHDHGVTVRITRIERRSEDEFVQVEVATKPLAFRIGDLLVASGAVSREAVEQRAKETRGKLGVALLEQGLVREPELYRALAQQAQVRFSNAEEVIGWMDYELASMLPKAFVETHRLLPFRKVGDTLSIVTSQPDASPQDVLKVTSSSRAEILLVTPTDFRRLRTAIDLGLKPGISSELIARDDLLERHPLDDAHLIELFEAILLEAIGERASDIHLERYGQRVRVRLRVDGDLRDVTHIQLNPQELAGVINVLKVAADMDISERRLPQGGRFRRRAGENVFDLRVQTQPSLHGEHAVIRLLPQTMQQLTVEDLGFDPELARMYRRLLESPAGLVLVVGPTGSGKSTTLYAALQVIAQDVTRKVITVEDPIEYSMENVQQTQVHPEIGFAFADAMRSFVRQDPDVILVGEIRDGETATEAIRASQTGHVVLSTLHSNDAVDAVQRLLDLGMQPNGIASELLAVVAQRLAKRICSHCREEVEPEASVMAELFPEGAPVGFRCWRGRGCDQCRGRGTHGRVAAVEFLRATPAVRRAISLRLPVDDLREIAMASGMHTMRDSALALVSQGIIPLAELPSLLPVDRMSDDHTRFGAADATKPNPSPAPEESHHEVG